MTRLFIHTEPFRKCWKAMGLNDDSLKLLENYLLEDPKAGAVIEGTGGARKYVLLLMITEEKAVEEE